MMTPIQALTRTPPPPPAAPSVGPPASAGQPFKSILLEALQQVNQMQHQANEAVAQLMTGEEVNPAEVLTTLQKADLTFRMMLQIRNKLVQAFQEVTNIRI